MLTCLRQKIVVDNLPRLAYNATTRLERVANADMAELADAHGSDTVTSVKNRGESVHSRRAEESEKTCQRGYGGTGRRTGDLVAVQKSEKIFWNY